MMNALLFIWQLPQNLIGMLLRLICKGEDYAYCDVIVRRAKKMKGGISLGKFIIVSQNVDNRTILHEYGHCKQSQMLGWLYLLIIGLPSLIWAWCYGVIVDKSHNGYYRFYTEKWADNIAGIRRG